MGGRKLLIAAEDTEQAANACAWAVQQAYREGDELHLVYVVCSLKPPMEVFHGLPGTAYSFQQPGEHHEMKLIREAKQALEDRYLPILKPLMVPYQLQLYAEREDAPASRVGEILLRRADEVGAALVVLAAHNKSTPQQGFSGSVTQYIMSNCQRPLAVIRPPEQEWEHVEKDPQQAHQQQQGGVGAELAAAAGASPPPPRLPGCINTPSRAGCKVGAGQRCANNLFGSAVQCDCGQVPPVRNLCR